MTHILKKLNFEYIKEIFYKLNITSNYNIYLIGGTIRDKLLNIVNKTNDIDFVIDFNTLNKFKGKYKNLKFSQFNTFSIKYENYNLDFATMREEIYFYSGALPFVYFTNNLKKDIYRRDFTINTFAYNIFEKKFIDYLDAYKDLRNKKIKILHNNSFYEDPTRIFRAIRFKVKLNFEYDKLTYKYFILAIKKNILKNISKARILNEIYLILKEENSVEILKEINNFQIFKSIFFENLDINNFSKLNKIFKSNYLNDFKEIYQEILILFFLDSFKNFSIIKQFPFKKKHINTLLSFYLNQFNYKDKLSIIFYLCKKNILIKNLNYYLKTINGKFIKNLGIKEGKIYKIILKDIFLKLFNNSFNNIKDIEKYILNKYINN